MEMDNEPDVVAASPVAPEGIADTEGPDNISEAARSRDAVTRKIRNPLSENRRSITPPSTPPPLRAATPPPSPRTPGPVPQQAASCEAATTERVNNGFLTAEPITAEIVPDPAKSANDEPAAQPTPAPGPDPGRLMELSGNIHWLSLDPDSVVPHKTATTSSTPKHKGLLAIAIVIVCGIAGNVALWTKSKDRLAKPAQSMTTSPAPSPGQTSLPLARELSTSGVLVPEIAPLPEKCHVEITVLEPGAQLFLDGNVAGGNQIKLEVAKEDRLHVVEALGAGFVPFKRSVSFASDVYLTISLQKARSSAHTAAQNRPVRPESRDVTTRVKPDGRSADEIGVSSRSTGVRRSTSKIDEEDPYAP